MTTPDALERRLSGLSAGMRVVVRHRIGTGMTDALGDLLSIDADVLVVRTRSGDAVVPRAAVVAAKEVPPAPARRGAPHLAVSMADLERLAVDGWAPLEAQRLGGWLLRAARGYTGRANSVLPVGDPGLPTGDAVDRAQDWYADRGLAATFSLFGPEGFSAEDDELGAELLRRGYAGAGGALVMTTAVDRLASMPLDHPAVQLSEDLSPQWLTAYAERRPGDPDVMRRILTGSPEQVFLSLADGARTVAVGRLAMAHAWAGVSALHVLPEYRRRSLGSVLMVAAAREARARGLRSMYLQVAPDALAAVALYRRLGFDTHHSYAYLRRPA